MIGSLIDVVIQNTTDISKNIVIILMTIFILLSSATLGVVIAKRQTGEPSRFIELSDRINSWWIMITVFATCILTSAGATISLFAFVSFLALKEYLSLIPTRRIDRRVLFWAYLSVPVQYYWIYTDWFSMFLVFIPVYMFLWLPCRMVTLGDTDGFLKAISTIQWGLMTTVFSISHVAYILQIPTGGYGVLLYLVLLTEFNDVAQYIFGKCFKGAPVAPKISPNKTISGLLGGLVSTAGLSWLVAPWLAPLMLPKYAIVAGLGIAISGFVGDLTISAVKRDLKIKDCSKLLPGHGGILDRVDSLTYSAPLFFHLYHYFS